MGYPDLNTMYKNGMGSVASFMGGQQASIARDADLEKLKQMQMETDQSAVMNPLNAQYKQGQINQQAAELPGVQGNSLSLGAKGMEDTALLGAKIAAKLSTMATQIGEDGFKQMGQDGEKFLQASQIIKQYPPALQKQVFMKAVQQYGGNVQSPMFQSMMQAPDEDFHTAVEAAGKGLSLASQKYTQESTSDASKAASAERIHTGNNATSIEVARIQGASRVEAAEKRAAAMGDKVDIIQKLLKVPMNQRDEEWNNQYESAVTTLSAIRSATVNPDLATSVITGGRPTTTVEKTKTAIDRVKELSGGGATGTPSTGQPDFAAMAKASGAKYEPEKYNYRVNPQTGQLERKPK